jgi:nitrogenase molybdenum-iron protein NifN
MVDGHKVLFERRIGIVGDADFVAGLVAFCQEVGLLPVMCAGGSNRGRMQKVVEGRLPREAIVLDDSDHDRICDVAKELKLDLVIGPSKVRAWSRQLGVPLVHLGFPIHDRFGAARLQTFGYEGTLQLLDRVINCLLERRQNEAGLGWSYL